MAKKRLKQEPKQELEKVIAFSQDQINQGVKRKLRTPIVYPPDVAETRTVLEKSLEAGMLFFESPEGYIMVGESDKQQVWCRKANGGQGMNINPKRA